MTAVLGAPTSFLLSLAACYLIVRTSGKAYVPNKIELSGFQSREKEKVSSFGGIAIAFAFIAASLLFSFSKQTAALCICSGLFFFIGIADDLSKLAKKSSDGLSSLLKLTLQLTASALAVYGAITLGALESRGPWIFLMRCLYIVTVVNAVNITDGLDGLAGTLSSEALIAFIILFSQSGLVFPAAFLLAAILAYLCFNWNPAKIFMGDSGSHLIGSTLGMLALLQDCWITMPLALLVMIAELASSALQIFSIRTFGKKVFPIAPLHHIFQMKKVKEVRITLLFSAIGLGCALLWILVEAIW